MSGSDSTKSISAPAVPGRDRLRRLGRLGLLLMGIAISAFAMAFLYGAMEPNFEATTVVLVDRSHPADLEDLVTRTQSATHRPGTFRIEPHPAEFSLHVWARDRDPVKAVDLAGSAASAYKQMLDTRIGFLEQQINGQARRRIALLDELDKEFGDYVDLKALGRNRILAWFELTLNALEESEHQTEAYFGKMDANQLREYQWFFQMTPDLATRAKIKARFDQLDSLQRELFLKFVAQWPLKELAGIRDAMRRDFREDVSLAEEACEARKELELSPQSTVRPAMRARSSCLLWSIPSEGDSRRLVRRSSRCHPSQ